MKYGKLSLCAVSLMGNVFAMDFDFNKENINSVSNSLEFYRDSKKSKPNDSSDDNIREELSLEKLQEAQRALFHSRDYEDRVLFDDNSVLNQLNANF